MTPAPRQMRAQHSAIVSTLGYRVETDFLLARLEANSSGGYRTPAGKVVTISDSDSALRRLWLDFAGLDSTDAIIAFADKYGELGLPEAITETLSAPALYGEPLSLWRKEIYAMRAVRDLLRPIHGRDESELRRFIRIANSKRSGAKPRIHFSREFGSSLPGQDSRASTLGYGSLAFTIDVPDSVLVRDELSAAKFVASHLVNERIFPNTGMALAFDGHRLEPRLTAANLLGALWLQVSDALAKGVFMQACLECGQPMIFDPSAPGRKPKRCGNNCRVKAHRSKKQRAASEEAE